MQTLLADPSVANHIIAQRRAAGIDAHDEVWDGVYVMPPAADNEHNRLAGRLDRVLDAVARTRGGESIPSPNLSDRLQQWVDNFRVPDVVTLVHDSAAVDAGTHIVGPADFVVEIASPDDQTYAKIDFYSKIGVRELLIVDRNPWALRLYRHDGSALSIVADLSPGDGMTAESQVLPIRFELRPAEPRPAIVISADEQSWRI